MEDFKSSNVLRNQANWEALRFYQKSKALYQITYNFSKRFLLRGDANVALSLCHFIDKMMVSYEKYLEQAFITEGGIKERMTAARLGYRTNQREELNRLHEELAATQSQLSAALQKLSETEST